MERGNAERRRGRRVNIQAPVRIRSLAGQQIPFREELTKDISLAGVYFETEQVDGYLVNDVVMASVSVPQQDTREFPFTRLAGRSRVVRVNELPAEPSAGRKRVGIALEFGDDLTALTALPARG